MAEYSPNSSNFPEPENQPDDVGNTQLSGPGGVFGDVSSVALNPGVLGTAPRRTAKSPTTGTEQRASTPENGAVALTDADLMLRVKAGDDAAFEYL